MEHFAGIGCLKSWRKSKNPLWHNLPRKIKVKTSNLWRNLRQNVEILCSDTNQLTMQPILDNCFIFNYPRKEGDKIE